MLRALLPFSFSRQRPPVRTLSAQALTGASELLRVGVIGAQLQRAVAAGNERTTRRALAKLSRLLGEAPAAPRPPAPPPDGRVQFICHALFLHSCYDFLCGPYLTKGTPFRESFHFCGGMMVEPSTFILTHLVPVEFSQQSAVGVEVDHASNRDALTWLDSVGLTLVAHFHTHPGSGPPSPSAKDLAFQERLEGGGRLHVCIGGIFTTDRQLRFFAGDPNRFSLRILGTIEEINREQHLYRLPVAERHLALPQPRSGG